MAISVCVAHMVAFFIQVGVYVSSGTAGDDGDTMIAVISMPGFWGLCLLNSLGTVTYNWGLLTASQSFTSMQVPS